MDSWERNWSHYGPLYVFFAILLAVTITSGAVHDMRDDEVFALQQEKEELEYRISDLEEALAEKEPDFWYMMDVSGESTCFETVGYDNDSCVMLVTFLDSGATYYYYGVTDMVWAEFCQADSMGTYYNRYIKGRYESYRVMK